MECHFVFVIIKCKILVLFVETSVYRWKKKKRKNRYLSESDNPDSGFWNIYRSRRLGRLALKTYRPGNKIRGRDRREGTGMRVVGTRVFILPTIYCRTTTTAALSLIMSVGFPDHPRREVGTCFHLYIYISIMHQKIIIII